MQVTRFCTSDPLNHLQRVLGILQRMDFALQSISMRTAESGLSRVSLRYRPAGGLSPETFAARVALLPGIEDLSHDSPG